jgi:hypothetical protein
MPTKINYPFIFTLVVFLITTVGQYVSTRNQVDYLCKDIEQIKQQIKDYNVLTYKVDKIDRKLDDIIVIIQDKR